MNFKFSKISESNLFVRGDKKILREAFSAKVFDVEEKRKNTGEIYYVFLLSQRKSKIVALAYGDICELLKNHLQPKKIINFPRETFKCKPKDKKFKSRSTCQYDLTFLQYNSKFISDARSAPRTSEIGNTVSKPCSLREVHNALAITSKSISINLKSIKFNGGKIYRYLGCEKCHSRIPRAHTDGKFYCKGKVCNIKNGRKRKIGVAIQRKICFTIYDLELSDDTDESVASVVVYNRICEKLLQKKGSDFNTDGDVVVAWQELIARSRFDITLKRDQKTKDSRYYPALSVNQVDNVVQHDAVVTEMTDIDDVYDGPWPDFAEFEMKLQQTEPHKQQDFAAKYEINSSPSGLVLLVNNYSFPYSSNERKAERRGSEIDIDLLYQGFVEMGYKIFRNECQMNIKTKMEFEILITDFKEQLLKEKVDSIFIIISSHGVNNGIQLPEEDECINVVEHLMIPFSDENFPEYQGKPKVFMPIVCQNIGGLDYRQSMDGQGNQLFDMMVCYPALPGYAHIRVSNKGTLYVRVLMRNLRDYAKYWDFDTILKKVQYDIKNQIISNELTFWTVPHHYGIVFGAFYLIPENKRKLFLSQESEGSVWGSNN